MNFFGHAVVARLRDPRPGFVLGAMLPDFASMIAARPPRPRRDDLCRGMAFHSQTDRVFHAHPAFAKLCRAAFADLSARGLARGSARAVAHIGTELLLDGAWTGQTTARAAYLSALEEINPATSSFDLRFERDDELARFLLLHARLAARGIDPDYASPERVATQLYHALHSRPRLAFSPEQTAPVQRWAEAARPEILAQADVIFVGLSEQLSL